MLRSPFKDRETGTSIIELMIAASILAMIGYAATEFFQRVNTSDSAARARANSVSEITTFLNSIERDFKLRKLGESPPLCPGGCTEFSIQRKVATDGEYEDMTILYETKCQTISSSDFKGENAKYSFGSAHLGKIIAAGNKAAMPTCIKAKACPDGTYPQIVITPTKTGTMVMPSYPRFNGKSAVLPDLAGTKASYRQGPIGAAICALASSASDKSDRITIEAAYVSAEDQIRFERREVAIPRSNVAKIQLLPSKAGP